MASTDSVSETQGENPPRIVSDIQPSDPTSSRSQKRTPRTKESKEKPGKARLSGMRQARSSTEARKKGEGNKRRIENLPDEHSRATTHDAAKKERHDYGTIEVGFLNTTYDPITESRFELVQRTGPDNEVDDDITDEGDDDLPDILGLSKRVTASRKRKTRHKTVDLTKEALTPEPDGDINHPTKRSRGELPSAEEVQWTATADEVLKQLQPKGQSLKDSVLQFIMEVLFAIFWPHRGDNKSARVAHPLWFNADEETLPQELRDFENYDVIFFPIHHKEIGHWTMGVLHITKRTIHCDFYNSVTSTTSAAKVKERLKAWIGEGGSSRVVSFENKVSSQCHFIIHYTQSK